MSSPITFSGFNNIDFNVVLNAIMQQASQPLDALQTRQKSLTAQASTFSLLATRLAALESAADDLGDAGSLSSHTATSTNDAAVAVSAGTGAQPGHYDVVVQELARAQVTASTSTVPDPTSTIVASGGSLTVAGVEFVITGDVTLEGLAQSINDTADLGVSASVVRTAPGAYRLVFTATETGSASAFTITNTLTGGTGLTFGDANSNGVSGDSVADNAVTASDAALLVNNIAVTGSTNVFTDVVPGVTLTALRRDPSATIGIDVDADSSAFRAKVDKFVTAYNDLVKFMNDQRISAGSGDSASIGRDPLLRQVRSALRTELLSAHGSGAFTRLSEVGVEFTSTGTLKVNQALFDESVASDGAAVRELFAGPAGVFPALQAAVESYTSVSGFIPATKDRLTDQAKAMDTQILNLQNRLALQRDALMRQFVEADQIMSRLRNQSGSLAGFGSSL